MNFLPETEQEYKFFKGNLDLSFFFPQALDTYYLSILHKSTIIIVPLGQDPNFIWNFSFTGHRN